MAARRAPQRRAPRAAVTLKREKDVLAQLTPGSFVAGMDEVGRGALAGPVSVGIALVGAAHLAPDAAPRPADLADSKLVPAAVRESLVDPVRQWAICSAVGHASPAEIDRSGIIAALRLAGSRALTQVRAHGFHPALVLLDGTHDWLTDPLADGLFAEQPPIPVTTIRKGDATCASIAAASILAKVERDALMAQLPDPGYGFASHKGYGAPGHVAAIRRLGPGEYHRRTWRLPHRAGPETEGMMDT